MSTSFTRPFALALLIGAGFATASHAGAQTRTAGFAIEQVMKPAFPYDLTAARRADRFAWIEFERGMRNVYTAAAPDFKAVRLTSTTTDDGVDIGPVVLSDDGSVVVWVRGHDANYEGTIVSPASDPLGGKREIWAASTTGTRPPWR